MMMVMMMRLSCLTIKKFDSKRDQNLQISIA